jgi:hypothetical protein
MGNFVKMKRTIMSDEHQEGLSGLTLRSMLVGILVVVTVSVAAPYSYSVLRSSKLASDYLPPGVIIPFIIIVILNALLKRIKPRWALRPAELIISLIMGLVASTICTLGLTSYLVAIIAAPYYFASPENRWAEYIHEHIPDWITLSKGNPAIQWFWEGLPRGEKIPWGAWAIPLFWWLSFIGVFFFICLCMVVILRKQWVEKERLVFPLTEVPMEMVKESSSKSLLPAFMHGKIFWIGFAIPLFIALWNIVGYFTPLFPTLPLRSTVNIARAFPVIYVYIFFPLIGFAYLINLDVSFSVWFFYLLGVLQVGIYNRFGFSIGKPDVYCSLAPSMGWQGFGALILMVFWVLWIARAHLKDVFKKAFNRNHSVDDSGELFSYRTAVFGLILGMLYLVGWLSKSGMSLKVIALFLPAAFVVFIGVTRIVVEGGLVFLRGPLTATTFSVFSLGSSAILAPSMTSLAFTYIWAADIKTFFMAAAAHAVKLGEMLRIKKRALLTAICIAAAAAVAVSVCYTIWIGYHHGAYNFNIWPFGQGATYPFQNVVSKMSNPFGPDCGRLKFLGIGALVMAGLTFMRYRFIWWPIHPIGFPIASVLFIQLSAFSIFLAWAAKSIILRLGGVLLYRNARPLFLGMIIGWFLGVGISFVVDMIWFAGQGHQIYGW